jgi:predicted ester cyclase
MALFRRNKKKEDGSDIPTGDMMDQLQRMSIEELLEATEVQYQQREVEKTLENRKKMVDRHLEVMHQPGGQEQIKASADFMDLGSARPYLAALSDITFSIEDQVLTGNDIFTIWTVTGRHTGELCGLVPTGNQVTLRGVTMSIIKEGVIATEYTYWDFPALTERLMSPAPS